MLDIDLSELTEAQAYLRESDETPSDNIRIDLTHGVEIRLFDDIELLVVSWSNPGFSTGRVQVLRDVIRDIASGHIGPCKFIAFDLKCQPGTARPCAEFASLIEELSNLIFQAPVLSIAWGRQDLSGAELELALACSMVVGEEAARLTFALDLVDSLQIYSLLAHKIGFVQAERLMENGTVLTAQAAHDLMVLHSVAPSEPGLDGIRRFAQSRMRRHNSACGLYRAQRLAMAVQP